MIPNFKDLYDSAHSIIKKFAYNYDYQYYIKTPNGMVLDIPSNHEYGNDRKGYEQWKSENKSLDASYSGVTSVRTITDKDRNITGYIFETKKSDNMWHEDLKTRYNEIFAEICVYLNVNDIDSFKYYIESDIELTKDFSTYIMNKLRYLIEVCERYEYDEEFQNLIDKIKG